MKFLFWFSFCFILYTYAGYPCLLYWGSKLFPKRINKADNSSLPRVTIVIAARNEEENIAKRVENLVQLEYPQDKMEIIVVSDGSTDQTRQIVQQIIDHRYSQSTSLSSFDCEIKLVSVSPHRGKPNAINKGLGHATGEIIVFTDARQQFEADAVKEIVANFNDPTVGCVSGELVFYDGTDTSIKTEMGAYWRYEKAIRKMEGQIHSVAGATGAIYAIRRSLFVEIPEETILDDVFVPMQVVSQGYRTVFDADAIAYDRISKDIHHEKKRKVRTLLGNYQLVALFPWLLSPGKNPIFWQFVSHKVFRLMGPFFYVMMVVSAFIANGFFYNLSFALLLVTLMSPFIGRFTAHLPFVENVRKLAQTFIFMNYFAFIAFLKFLRKDQKTVWQ